MNGILYLILETHVAYETYVILTIYIVNALLKLMIEAR